MASSAVVSVSKATRPAWHAPVDPIVEPRARRHRFVIAAIDRPWRAPARRQQQRLPPAVAASVPAASSGVEACAAVLRLALRGVAPTETRERWRRLGPKPSAMRFVSVLNSIVLQEAEQRLGIGILHAQASRSAISSGTSSFSGTSSREMRACSANSISFSRRFGCLISPARASSVSRSP